MTTYLCLVLFTTPHYAVQIHQLSKNTDVKANTCAVCRDSIGQRKIHWTLTFQEMILTPIVFQKRCN